MDWRYNTMWFDQVQQGKIYVQNYKENTSYGNKNEIGKAEYAFLSHVNHEKNQVLDQLRASRIMYLDLTWSNTKDFQRLGAYTALKRLETHYCTKLETDNGLSKLADTLEFLHINQSKKFVFTGELLQLKRLKVLCMNACSPITSLDFLKHFPQLIDFRFVDTNILDGNLQPILDHPTIRTVSYSDKRHYTFTNDRLQEELDKKHDKEYRTYSYKGEYMTFRYDFD